jgi:hypothetical protein
MHLTRAQAWITIYNGAPQRSASPSSRRAGQRLESAMSVRLRARLCGVRVQAITGHVGQVNQITVALKGDVHSSASRSDAAAARIQSFVSTPAGAQALGTGNRSVIIEKFKQDAVESAEEFGNIFTSFFLILGLSTLRTPRFMIS